MKQITKILNEVNYNLDKIKLVKCIGCHNEEGWIEYVLKNNYDEFDVIRIVEGAVEGRPGSTPDGHSTDRTLEIIRNFPDPDDKIELYQLGRHFKSLEEQKQIFLDVASEGEWLFIVDADEFYMEGDVTRVRRAIEKNPNSSEIIPTFLHFYRDFFHVKAPHPEWQPQHQRIIKYRPGMRYHTHPVATLPDGVCSYFHPQMQPLRHTVPGLYIYHYGHAKGHEFHKMKAEFYRSELEKFEGRGGNAANEFDLKLDEFVNFRENPETILSYDGPHPEALIEHPQRWEPAIDADGAYYARDDFKKWKEDKVYSKDKLPNIVVWMEPYWGTQRMEPFYNTVEV
jgi:glycosyl transferase family 2